MTRLLIAIALIVGALISASLAIAQTPDAASNQFTTSEDAMETPKLLIFDVNETLLDLAPLKTSAGKALGGREDLLPLWFSTMLHYSLVETLSDQYHDFGEIGTAALLMVAESQGVELTEEEAKQAIIPAIRSLPPHPDVVQGIQRLKQAGYRIVSLTNSSSAGVEAQFQNAGLTELFERRYSVDMVGKFKPHPDTYAHVLRDLDVKPGEAMMVAAHAWDLAGAKNAGLQTAFIKRPGKTLYPNASKPDVIVADLNELAGRLTSKAK
ncbi:haloacid dehalogenase type II [Rhodopirellula sp. JC740]|uniref:Haloacid dehalogenase type II n=1 Tax=Rhodopirellula halodulae TaxID=2894198 RepID=A0ABS8NJ50_9BACT|nr:haloacid dehalogenase type II [Rhodopirellula sp. JC740]MCC9643587.1 haloacid dehalogenase type II [Rhodopirellula sp. JC740]